MKKIISVLLILIASLGWLSAAGAAETDLSNRLAGRILLQVESYGRAWYVDPLTLTRYYLQDGNEAYFLMRTKALGITNQNLNKIPTKKGQRADQALVNRLKGQILLQVEEHGEAWYVDPIDGLRHYLADGQAAFELMKAKGLGISNADLAKIPINQEQIVHDTTFNDVAYAKFDGDIFSDEYNANQILPLASLSKLMTALVFLDTNPDWNRQITITQEEIDYPKTLAGNDNTSEVDLSAGDTLSVNDLWVAMLVASSNQAAVTLADNSGFNRSEFAQKMNDKAAELGLTKTKFYDPSGLDAHNVTTAQEMAKIAWAAFNQPKIVEPHQYQNYAIKVVTNRGETKTVTVADRNYSLQQFIPQASKTGYLVEAQRTVALKKDNQIIVVMHALSMNQRNDIIKKLINNSL
ncbi:MAG: serine hydrolase [Patescibacteria group bacterium]|jgi:hypothetical protein|nr:serine hydrolase [Patescibacteria group bacterium]